VPVTDSFQQRADLLLYARKGFHSSRIFLFAPREPDSGSDEKQIRLSKGFLIS